MGEIFQSIFNEVAGNNNATRETAKAPLIGMKTGVGLSLIPILSLT